MKNPGKVRVRTYVTKSPGRSEALHFIDWGKSPSTFSRMSLFKPNWKAGLSRNIGTAVTKFTSLDRIQSIFPFPHAKGLMSQLQTLSNFPSSSTPTHRERLALKVLLSKSQSLPHFTLLVNLASFHMFGESCPRLHFGWICEEEDWSI